MHARGGNVGMWACGHVLGPQVRWSLLVSGVVEMEVVDEPELPVDRGEEEEEARDRAPSGKGSRQMPSRK